MISTQRYTTPITRSNDGYIAGVCAGLGAHFGISPTLLRLAWIVALLFFGTGILLYLALWWIVPREDAVPVETTVWKRNHDGTYAPPLRRTAVDRKVLGVCGGLARRWGIDPSVLRLAVLALATLSFGLVIVVYLVAAIVIPGSDAPMRSHVDPVQL